MPNQEQPTAESKPKVKKAVAVPKTVPPAAKASEASEAPKAAKASRAEKPSKNAASPKTPRKRSQADAAHPTQAPEFVSQEAHVLEEVNDEMIAVRAYFLAENRHAKGIPGDHASDWHEAAHQLRAEAAAIAASLKLHH